MTPVTIHEIQCKSIINRSRISSIDYTVNPYTGCQHGCVYCYARFMSRYTKHHMVWGSYCDVKINAGEIIQKQIKRIPRGLVSLSTVTDAYQPAERKYRITRRILKVLAEHRFPVSVLTKSDLVLRDLDLLSSFDKEICDVGFSITSLNEKIRRIFEPHAPPIHRRIKALRDLHDAGIKTWLFLAPVLPISNQDTIISLLNAVSDHVDSILVDTLNIKCGNWSGIKNGLYSVDTGLLPKWKGILFIKESRMQYYRHVWKIIHSYCEKHQIPVQFCDIG